MSKLKALLLSFECSKKSFRFKHLHYSIIIQQTVTFFNFVSLRLCDFAVYIFDNQFTAKAQRRKEKIIFVLFLVNILLLKATLCCYLRIQEISRYSRNDSRRINKYVYKNFQVLNGFYLIDFQAKANYQLTTINCPLTYSPYLCSKISIFDKNYRMENQALFADIILPLALPQMYTYLISKELEPSVAIGKRVVVQFGKKKLYTALVRRIHTLPPSEYEIKEIIAILDEKPIISEQQFQFWEWIANYYLCTLGEVMKAALPSGLKLESETQLFYNQEFTDKDTLTEKETKVADIIENHNVILIDDLQSIVKQRNLLAIVKSLIDKNVIFVEENLNENYKIKTESYIKLNDCISTESQLQRIFAELEKAPKQLEILMVFAQNLFQAPIKSWAEFEMKKKSLNEKSKAAPAALNTLIDKNILKLIEKQVDRIDKRAIATKAISELNDFQQDALLHIEQEFEKQQVVLLHGITSSGKTEIYIHLIHKTLLEGKQVLYLLPEIALTTQIINRLRSVFGNLVGVYHSKFNDAERVEIWSNILEHNSQQSTKYQIILGVRSSIFLPFSKLGLIIVDEEHENTFKQYDPSPRYNARDSALFLAKLHNAKTLLGTATPSFESYYNAQQKKYGLVEIKRRYLDIQLPEVQIVDVAEAYRKKMMNSHFSFTLLEHIKEALEQKEQVILFQNRRGFSPFLQCNTCGWIPHCKYCDVCLTYHKNINQLVCHYCGYSYSTPTLCNACGDAAIQTKGFGTEKLEDELPLFFPEARVARLDLDSTRSKKAYHTIIGDFEQQRVDILIGTQMITKGLDFDNVSLVGIMNADSMLNYPDFRAFERSYQLMAQVSGRAGRKHKRGKVIIQTMQPKIDVLNDVINNNFAHLYYKQLDERKLYKYPPFYRLIRITLKHKQKEKVVFAAAEMAKQLHNYFTQNVLGPEEPYINRIQNFFLQTILLKIEKDKSQSQTKKILQNIIVNIKTNFDFGQLIIAVDVDPM